MRIQLLLTIALTVFWVMGFVMGYNTRKEQEPLIKRIETLERALASRQEGER